jgi:hypothetical protein
VRWWWDATIAPAAMRCAMPWYADSPPRPRQWWTSAWSPRRSVLGAAPRARRRRHPDHGLAQSARIQRVQDLRRHGSLHGAGIQRCTATSHRPPMPRGGGCGTSRSSTAMSTTSSPDGATRPSDGASCTTAATGRRARGAAAVRGASAWTCTGLFTESDGTFPNHHPDPTVPENLEDCIAAVRETGRRTRHRLRRRCRSHRRGRCAGRIIWGDHLLILYARDVLARTGTGQPIIFDVKCSQALSDAITAAMACRSCGRRGTPSSRTR